MRMKQADTTFVVAWVFTAATTFFYACTMWLKLKLPTYYPTEHTWGLGKKDGVIGQGWYGKGMFAIGAAAIVALIVWLILRTLTKKDLSQAGVKCIGLIAIAVTVVCTGCVLYYEFNKWGVF